MLVREHGATIVAQLEGNLDRLTVSRIRKDLAALARRTPSLVVDLGRVDFVDSAGLHGLFGVARPPGGVDCRVSFVLPGDSPLTRVFDIVRLSDVAPVHRTVQSALGGTATAGGSAGRRV